jgi:hypothetical protein
LSGGAVLLPRAENLTRAKARRFVLRFILIPKLLNLTPAATGLPPKIYNFKIRVIGGSG